MENMKEVVREFDANIARWQKEWPEQRQGFSALTRAAKAPGALEQKYKYLIAVGIAVAEHCHWCIGANVKSALAHGATKEQVMEAGWVAVQMGGGPSLAYLQLVQQAVDDLAT
jgi:pyruvate dehydrogenase E2 component (dihydrolipoamide acetyltransferase)